MSEKDKEKKEAKAHADKAEKPHKGEKPKGDKPVGGGEKKEQDESYERIHLNGSHRQRVIG